jgi:hypothetical protein
MPIVISSSGSGVLIELTLARETAAERVKSSVSRCGFISAVTQMPPENSTLMPPVHKSPLMVLLSESMSLVSQLLQVTRKNGVIETKTLGLIVQDDTVLKSLCVMIVLKPQTVMITCMADL